MTKDYNAIHEERLKAMKEKVLGSAIYDELEIKSIDNIKLDTIIGNMTKITGTQIYSDFNFRTGKIFGILKAIVLNSKHRQELLLITGLTDDYIDLYYNVCGNPPYREIATNTFNPGRPMNVKACREFIPIVASKFGVIVEESDLYDITQERWDNICKLATAKALKSIEDNNKNGDTVPKEGYEE